MTSSVSVGSAHETRTSRGQPQGTAVCVHACVRHVLAQSSCGASRPACASVQALAECLCAGTLAAPRHNRQPSMPGLQGPFESNGSSSLCPSACARGCRPSTGMVGDSVCVLPRQGRASRPDSSLPHCKKTTVWMVECHAMTVGQPAGPLPHKNLLCTPEHHSHPGYFRVRL